MKHNEKIWKAFAEVEQAKIFHFPQGLAGFPDANNYIILNSGHGDIACMQSTEQVEAAFLVTPWDKNRLGDQPELTPDQRECLQCTDTNELLWLVVLNPFTDPEWVLANTRAPVAIHPDSALGMQAIQAHPHLDLHFHWLRQPGAVRRAA